MNSTKIGTLFMFSIIALASIGMSYAHWEETLTVRGVMYTDNIDPCFQNAISNDPYEGPIEYRLDPWNCGQWHHPATDVTNWNGIRKNKDVGHCNITIDADDCTKLGIEIKDAYPCYWAHPYWEIWNFGSVPVNLVSYKIVNLSFTPENGRTVVIAKNFNLEICKEYYVKWYFDETNGEWKVTIREGEPAHPERWDFMIHPTGDFAIGDQLDPERWIDDGMQHHANQEDETYVFYSDLCVHFLNGCEQLAIYDFDVEMVFYNWPEVCEPEVGLHNADLMLVLDNSGSINDTEMATYKTAAHAFISAIHSDNAITGQTHFNDNGALDLHLTMHETAAHTAITNLLTTGGMTNLYEGMLLAYDELMLGTYDAANDPGSSVGDRLPDADFADIMVVITDGACNRPTNTSVARSMAQGVADNCDTEGIEIYVLGVGIPDGDYDIFLRDNIATTPDHFFDIAEWSDLEQALLDLVT